MSNKMRLLASLVLFAPSLALSLGADDVSFYGLWHGEQVVQLNFIGDPESWSQHSFIYGSTQNSQLSYCWFSDGPKLENSLACSASKATAASVIYKLHQFGNMLPQYDDRTAEIAIYRSIAQKAKLGNGKHRGDATLMAVYACIKGCSSAIPRHLFKVGAYD